MKNKLLVAVFVLTAACSNGGGSGDEQLPPEAALFKDLTLATPLKEYGHHNPVMTQRFGADPWALVYEDRVYLYMTGDTIRRDDNGDVLPNLYDNINTIRLLSSSDLVNWTEHQEVKATGPSGAARWATNSWAPAAAYREIDGQDKFFLYFADNANGIGVLSADTPVGPFTDPIKKALVNRSTPNCNNVTWMFDPAVLIDDDGRAYFYFGGGIPSGGTLANFNTTHPLPGTERAVELGDNMISIVGRPEKLNAPFIYEDSGINKIGDKYYYSYCANFQVHHYMERPEEFPDAAKIVKSGGITYMIGDNPLGPFTLQKMILPHPDEMFQQHGDGGNNHHAMFEFRGKYYMAYHSRLLEMAMGIPASVPREGYRITHIDEVTIRDDGTIDEIEGTRTGVRQAGYFYPYQTTSAATMAVMAGISTQAVTGSTERMLVTDIHSGDWIALHGVNFGNTGAKKFICKVTPPETGNGVIEIRQDSLNGKPIGYVVIEAGDSEITVELLRKVTGIHDLVFVFYGEGYEFEEWRFSAN